MLSSNADDAADAATEGSSGASTDIGPPDLQDARALEAWFSAHLRAFSGTPIGRRAGLFSNTHASLGRSTSLSLSDRDQTQASDEALESTVLSAGEVEQLLLSLGVEPPPAVGERRETAGDTAEPLPFDLSEVPPLPVCCETNSIWLRVPIYMFSRMSLETISILRS